VCYRSHSHEGLRSSVDENACGAAPLKDRSDSLTPPSLWVRASECKAGDHVNQIAAGRSGIGRHADARAWTDSLRHAILFVAEAGLNLE
jgi:hypothetical protein